MKKLKTKQFYKEISDKLFILFQDERIAQMHAKWLLESLLKKNFSEIIISDYINLIHEQEVVLQDWLNKLLIDKMPFAYVVGQTDFLGLKITVEKPILIPRQDTECWLEELIEKLNQYKLENLRILDLCTGSGCIALALASFFKNAQVIGTDISQQAINLALKNKKLNNIENCEFLISDLFLNINKNDKFDLIVSNPPYISYDEIDQVEEQVIKWEDPLALFAPDNGLYFYKTIISQAKKFLKHNIIQKSLQMPQIALEIGQLQGYAVSEIFKQHNYYNIVVKKDLSLKNRAAWASVC